jgi:hypothetical protein
LFFSRSGPTHQTATVTTTPNDSLEIPDSEKADQQSERNDSGGKIKRISNPKASDQQKANMIYHQYQLKLKTWLL